MHKEIAVIPIQEIIISTDKGAQHTIHIIQPQPDTPFSSEVIVYDPQFHALYSSLVPIGASYSSAEEAFENAFKWVAGWLKAKGQAARKINNPCNCEFLDAAAQSGITQKHGISTQVQVNA